MFGKRPAGRAPGYFSAVTSGTDARAVREGPLERLSRLAKLSLFSGAGVVAGLLTELQNRGDDSVALMLAGKAAAAAGLVGVAGLPLYAVFAGLVVIGAAVVLYFRPRSARGAFAQGFGAFAALVTAMPQPDPEVRGPQDAAAAPPAIERAEALPPQARRSG